MRNPDRSSKEMKPGNCQNDNVSGEAKLSCTRDTVRSVGRQRWSETRDLLRSDHACLLELPCAWAEPTLPASIRVVAYRDHPGGRH